MTEPARVGRESSKETFKWQDQAAAALSLLAVMALQTSYHVVEFGPAVGVLLLGGSLYASVVKLIIVGEIPRTARRIFSSQAMLTCTLVVIGFARRNLAGGPFGVALQAAAVLMAAISLVTVVLERNCLSTLHLFIAGAPALMVDLGR